MKSELIKKIEQIENRLKTVVDQSSGENIAFELNERTNLLSETPQIMELATKIYDEAKGKLAEEMFFDEKKLNAKQQIQIMYISGKLKEENALYVRAERCVKALDNSIKGLITLLSYDKTITSRT